MNTTIAQEMVVAREVNVRHGVKMWRRQERQGLADRLRGVTPRTVIPDAREDLECMGFEILEEGRKVYRVRAPSDWRMGMSPGCDNGYWTSVYDDKGVERMTQFIKYHGPLPGPVGIQEREEDGIGEAFINIYG